MAISIGDAILFLSADDKGLKKGLANSEKMTKASASRMSTHANAAAAHVGRGMASMASKMAIGLTGILGVSALKNYATQWIQLGDQLEEQSQRTGLGVEMLSRLNFVAGKAGLSLENLEVTTRQMSKVIASTAGNTRLLGISIRELKTMSPEQQFMKLLEALGKVENLTLRSALAMKVFGKSGTMILPLLEGGMKKLTDEMRKADKSGVVFTAQDAANAAAYADAIQEFSNSWIRLGGAVAQSPIGELVFAEMEGLTAAFNTQGWADLRDTLSEMMGMAESALGLTNKKTAAKEAAGEKSFQDAKARNEAAKAGTFNPASDTRTRDRMRQAMIFGTGQDEVYNRYVSSSKEPAFPMDPREPIWPPRPFENAAYKRQASAAETIAGRIAEGDYYGTTPAQRQGVSEQKIAAGNVQYNTYVISHANFAAGDDMIKRYNRMQAMSPGI